MKNKLKHLEFIQGVINRLATNSFQMKGWSVVLVAATLILLARDGRLDAAPIALGPVLVFWGLDGYFLWQERLFRALYDHVRALNSTDFSMNISPFRTNFSRTWLGATLSRTLLFFYCVLIIAIVLATFALGSKPLTSFVELEDALTREGYEIADGRLQQALPTDVNLPEVRSELENLLDIHGFETAKEHLEQAKKTHARGQWAAANGQIRTFFEALLKGITDELDGPSDEPLRNKRLLQKLGQHGILKKELNERGFVDGLWRRLHPQGPHPGLSDKEDSTFRLHVTVLTAALLLKRFDRHVQNSTQ